MVPLQFACVNVLYQVLLPLKTDMRSLSATCHYMHQHLQPNIWWTIEIHSHLWQLQLQPLVNVLDEHASIRPMIQCVIVILDLGVDAYMGGSAVQAHPQHDLVKTFLHFPHNLPNLHSLDIKVDCDNS